MTTIPAPDLVKLRTGQHQATPYLSVLQPATLLSALVNNGSIVRGARAIAYDTGTGSAASFALIQEGQTLVVTTADGEKKVRVKSIAGNETSGTIQIDENGIDFADDQPIVILHEYRIWPVFPRISGGVFYKYYDLPYTSENSQPPPVAIAGPHQAAFMTDTVNTPVSSQIATGADDGHITNSGTFSNAGSAVLFGASGATIFSDFIRFATNATGTISSSYLTFIPSTNATTTECKVRIRAEAANNSAAVTSAADYHARLKTTAYVDWTVPAWTAGVAAQSPDLSAVIQEILNRPGWAAGNYIQIFIEDNGSDANAFRAFVSYDSTPANAATLTITYGAPAAIIDLDASDSYAIASGGTISSYAWACTGGTIANAAIATTTITFDTAGQYWLTLTVTDSNGKTQTTHRAIFIYDAANPPYKDFTVTGVSGSWQGGGYRFGIRATGDVTLADFPDGALCLLWYEGKINGTEDYVNLWGVGDNVICSGYIRTDNDGDDLSSGAGVVEFSVVTPESLLDELTEFGTISITATAAPTTWYEYASWLTVGRAIHHLLRWHSTAFSCVDIYGLTTNVLGMQQANFTEPSLLQQVNTLGFQRGHFARMVSDRLGRLHFATDSQYLNDAGRAALDTVFSLVVADISGDINITRQPEGRIGAVDLDGFAFDGSTGTPYISICPGYINSISIPVSEFRGAGSQPVKNQVLASQADSNEKAGRVLAVNNNPYNEIRLSAPGNYLGAFDIVPSIGWYTWGIANSDLKRALELNGLNLVCRSVEQAVDTQAGTIRTSVTLEVEAIGPDGIPGNYPTSQPAAGNPPGPVVLPEPEPAILVYSEDSTGYGKAVLLDIDPADIGTPAAFGGTDTILDPAVAALGNDKAIVVYRNATLSNVGRAAVLDIADGVITPGTPEALEAGVIDLCNVCALSATQAIAVYRLTGTGWRAVVLDISGTTITVGSAITIEVSVSSTALPGLTRLEDTKAVMSYVTALGHGSAVVLSVSGSTVSAGAPATFQATAGGNLASDTALCTLSSTQAVLAYIHDDGANKNIEAVVLDISITTITVGTLQTAFSWSSALTSIEGKPFVAALSSSQFVIVAGEADTPTVKGAVGTVTGSAISLGAAAVLAGTLGSTNSESCMTLVDNTALYAYADSGVIYAATADVSGTSISGNSDETTSFSGNSLSMTRLVNF